MKSLAVISVLAMLPSKSPCAATVVEYTNQFDPTAKANWQVAAETWSTITFAELPLFTLITDQYAELGVLFTDGSDYTHGFSLNTFPNDGYGLNGALDETTLEFSQPMHAIAVDFPGGVAFKLYYQGQLIYTSNFLMPPPGGIGGFAGLISDQPFDKVFIFDPGGGLAIDDLFFGPPIPAPGALGALGAAIMLNGMRRRRR